MAEQIVIEGVFKVDGKKISGQFNKIERQGKKAGKKAGKGFARGFSKNASRGFAKVGAAALAAGTAIAAAFAGRKLIQAAAVQEDAVNKINTALKLSGKFTRAASKDFQAFASSLQDQTKFGDEVILQNAALLQSLGQLSIGGLKEATQASLDLAAGLQVDLGTAITLVGKAAAGEISTFSRYGVIIKKGATKNETFANTLRAINDQFSGAAAAEINTFSGATKQLGDSFGDVLEELGFIITKSPAVISAIKAIRESFKLTGASVKEFAGSGNLLNDAFVKIGRQIKGFSASFGPILEIFSRLGTLPFKVIINAFKTVFRLVSAFGRLISPLIKTVFGGITKVFAKFKTVTSGAVDFIRKKLGPLGKFIGGLFDKTNDGITSAVSNLIGPGIPKAIQKFSDDASAALGGGIVETAKNLGDLFDPLVFDEKLTAIGDRLIAFGDTAASPIEETANRIKKANKEILADTSKTGKAMANIVNQAIVQTVSAGIQQLTKSLLFGAQGFDNFAKQVLGIMGEMAIKLGETLILTGIGMESLFELQGAKAIVAGAGLIALGTILKQFSGGKGGVAGAPAGAGAGGFEGGGIASGGVDDTITEQQDEREEPSTQVALTVNGDVLDSDETGTRLVRILNESFERDGVVITNGAFA